MTTGIIVFAHGSRIEAANQAVRSVAADLGRDADAAIVEAAFLELGTPSLELAADLLVSRGVQRLIVLPYFLTPGMHLERDLPILVDRISQKHKGVHVSVAASLDGHPGLVTILADRARACMVEPPPLK